jgi:hypothetical protein
LVKSVDSNQIQKCSKCGETKNIADYYKSNLFRCKKCIINASVEWHRNNPKKTKEAIKRWKKNHPEKAKPMMKRQQDRKRLKRRNENLQWYLDWRNWDIYHCELCGYDRYSGNIDFHHDDPKIKTNKHDTWGCWIILSLNTFKKKVQSITHKILCNRCHGEFHAGLLK